jgi:phosphohistidine phosphatase SixA
MHGMNTRLCLIRHGRASGQGPEAHLLPEGEAYVASLGRRLAREGFAPVAAYCSPYKRAVDTARLLLGELGCSVKLVQTRRLVPEGGPADALEALTALGLPEGPVLVVTHLPLVGLLLEGLTEKHVDFTPGTFAEVEMTPDHLGGVLTRVIDSV